MLRSRLQIWQDRHEFSAETVSKRNKPGLSTTYWAKYPKIHLHQLIAYAIGQTINFEFSIRSLCFSLAIITLDLRGQCA